jgi:hypothetical protein
VELHPEHGGGEEVTLMKNWGVGGGGGGGWGMRGGGKRRVGSFSSKDEDRSPAASHAPTRLRKRKRVSSLSTPRRALSTRPVARSHPPASAQPPLIGGMIATSSRSRSSTRAVAYS